MKQVTLALNKATTFLNNVRQGTTTTYERLATTITTVNDDSEDRDSLGSRRLLRLPKYAIYNPDDCSISRLALVTSDESEEKEKQDEQVTPIVKNCQYYDSINRRYLLLVNGFFRSINKNNTILNCKSHEIEYNYNDISLVVLEYYFIKFDLYCIRRDDEYIENLSRSSCLIIFYNVWIDDQIKRITTTRTTTTTKTSNSTNTSTTKKNDKNSCDTIININNSNNNNNKCNNSKNSKKNSKNSKISNNTIIDDNYFCYNANTKGSGLMVTSVVNDKNNNIGSGSDSGSKGGINRNNINIFGMSFGSRIRGDSKLNNLFAIEESNLHLMNEIQWISKHSVSLYRMSFGLMGINCNYINDVLYECDEYINQSSKNGTKNNDSNNNNNNNNNKNKNNRRNPSESGAISHWLHMIDAVKEKFENKTKIKSTNLIDFIMFKFPCYIVRSDINDDTLDKRLKCTMNSKNIEFDESEYKFETNDNLTRNMIHKDDILSIKFVENGKYEERLVNYYHNSNILMENIVLRLNHFVYFPVIGDFYYRNVAFHFRVK